MTLQPDRDAGNRTLVEQEGVHAGSDRSTVEGTHAGSDRSTVEGTHAGSDRSTVEGDAGVRPTAVAVEYDDDSSPRATSADEQGDAPYPAESGQDDGSMS